MDQSENLLVSVVIPVYNAEAYLRSCVDSVLGQTHRQLQIILVDDGSLDRSGAICDEYAGKDPRVIAFHQKNSGVSAARNRGIEESEGQYLCFTDSDDSLPSESIESLLRAMNAHNVQAVFGNFNYLYDNKRLKRLARIKPGLHSKQGLFNILIDDGTLSGITFGSVCGAIYKLDVIRENKIRFRENLKVNEDGVFNIEYCLNSAAIWYESKAVYNYRQWEKHSQANASVVKSRLDETNSVIKQLAADHFPAGEATQRQLEARTLFCVFQLSLFVAGGNKKSAAPMLRTLWREPLISRSEAVLNFAGMNRYKRMLWSLIVRKKAVWFCLLMHDVYPRLKSIVKR